MTNAQRRQNILREMRRLSLPVGELPPEQMLAAAVVHRWLADVWGKSAEKRAIAIAELIQYGLDGWLMAMGIVETESIMSRIWSLTEDILIEGGTHHGRYRRKGKGNSRRRTG